MSEKDKIIKPKKITKKKIPNQKKLKDISKKYDSDINIEDFDSNIVDPKYFQGNQGLKRFGVQISWTKEMVEEWIRCKEDPIYFIEKYIKIVTEDGLVQFKLRDYQIEMITSMVNNRFTISLMARQSGKTEVVRGFAIWMVLFQQHKTVAILANKEKTAIEILGKIQTAYKNLPLWIQCGISQGGFNKKAIELENGSRIIVAATSPDSIRGYTISALVLDECAFVENFEEFYSAVHPTISAGKETKLIMVSTPNGLNHFYKFWKESEEGKNEFYRVFVPWYKVPGRDEKWKKETLESSGNNLEKFAQEYECEFLGSSGTLISGWKLSQLQWATPIRTKDNLMQYYKPHKERSYALCADVAEGKGLDFSAFQVIDVTEIPYMQVCTFKSNTITPQDYAGVIHRTGKMYNDAAVLIEINAIGAVVAHSLYSEFEYESILNTTNVAGRNGKKVTLRTGEKFDRGLKTTKTTKLQGCNMLKMLIEQDKLIINDNETINELSTFSRKRDSFEAEPMCHDDMVMGLVIFAWLTDQQYFKEYTNIDTLKALRERSDEELNNDMTPFGYLVDGREEEFVIEKSTGDIWFLVE